MPDSSESDVIQRTRHSSTAAARRRLHSDSFSDDEYSDEYGNLFFSLFGNGDEYAYIYDDKPNEESAHEQPTTSNVPIDVDACFEFVINELPADGFKGFTKDIVADLINGFVPEFISFYKDKLTVRECYYIQDLISEFRINGNINKINKQKIQKVKEPDGLLSIEEYMDNITAGERIHQPNGNIEVSSGWDDEDEPTIEKYKLTIERLASNPLFVSAVRKSVIFSKLGFESIKYTLIRLYSSSESGMSNEVRKEIIEEAYKMVEVDEREINSRLAQQGYIDNSNENIRFDPSNVSLQSLTNAIYSLHGPAGTYSGLFLDKHLLRAVLIDERGNLVSQATFSASDFDGIRKFVSTSSSIILTSNTHQVKQFTQRIELPVLYVPRSFSFFKDDGLYSQACNVARAVQNPLVYFSRLALSPSCSARLIFRRAISICAVLLKPDWSFTHSYGSSLLNLFGLFRGDANTHFDYGSVRSLEDLRSHFTEPEFASIGTFFSLGNSSNCHAEKMREPLDATHVHPKDYSWAIVLCRGTLGSLHDSLHGSVHGSGSASHGKSDPPTDPDVVRSVLSNPRLLCEMNLPDEVVPDMLRPATLRDMLLGPSWPFFSGASDQHIFADVVPLLELGEVCTGMVIKVGEGYHIVDVGSAAVYIRNKDSEANPGLINQILSVRIGYPSYKQLSYDGEFVEVDQPAIKRFTNHRLYRNGDQNQIEEEIRREGVNVLVRGSSVANCMVVVCRIESSLYFSYRVEESIGGEGVIYRHGEETYNSVDEFIVQFVTPLYRLIREIREFKYFYGTEEEAVEYVKVAGRYTRYAICLSREHPGYLEFLYGNKRVLVWIGGSGLQYKSRQFGTLGEFLAFAKQNMR